VGISLVKKVIEGICGTSESSDRSSGVGAFGFVESFGLGDVALERLSGAAKLGELGECLILCAESTSVASVVPLFLVVELEGARPESLRESSCNLERSLGDESCCEPFGPLKADNGLGGEPLGGVAVVIWTGAFAAFVFS